MPDGARVLDVATGSGAVLAIASEHNSSFALHGVDQADIGTDGPGKSTLHPNCAIEALPFEDSSFDAITSQYGFEYSDTPQTITELARVAAPGAALKLLVHARDGEVHKATSARLKRIKTLMQGKKNLITATRELCDLNPAYTPAPKLKKLEKKFRSQCVELRAKFSDAPPDDAALYAVGYLHDLVANRHRYDPADTLRCITELNDDTNAYAFRIRSMLSAAQSEEDMLEIAKQLTEAGFGSVHQELLKQDNNVIGWDLSAVFGV